MVFRPPSISRINSIHSVLPIDDEGRSLGFLLRDLLGLDGGGVLPAEAELGNGDVVQDDVEISGAVGQLLADQHGDLLTLRDQLGSVELGHNALLCMKRNEVEMYILRCV